MHTKNGLKCDVCGQFISYEDFDLGLAKHDIVTPDSDCSSEEWLTLCKKHNNKENQNE